MDFNNGATWLFYFVCNIEKLSVWCIFATENYYSLTKNSRKSQLSVTKRCTSLSNRSGMFRQNLLKVPVKKLNLYCTWTSSQVTFKVSSRIFFTYLPIQLFTKACLCLIWHTYFVFVFIFVKGIASRFNNSWDGKRKKNKF